MIERWAIVKESIAPKLYRLPRKLVLPGSTKMTAIAAKKTIVNQGV